jgi:DNA-binding NtrC family response regulator
MNPVERALFLRTSVVSAREIELRREIVAAMRLRLTVRQQNVISLRSVTAPPPVRAEQSRVSAKTILLVSDDAAWRSVIRSFLEHVGFKVASCADADRAEQTFCSCGVDLAVIDMPGAADAGMSLARRLSLVRPGLQVIIVGERAQPSMEEPVEEQGWKYLMKPFPMPALLGMIQRNFDKKNRPRSVGPTENPSQRTPGQDSDPLAQADKENAPVVSRIHARTALKPLHVLTISDYEGLRWSREFLLRAEGYQVESLSSHAFFEISTIRAFDVAILCQSVERRRAIRIADLLHRHHPSMIVVRVNPFRQPSDGAFDFSVEAIAGPEALLDALRNIAALEPKKQS